MSVSPPGVLSYHLVGLLDPRLLFNPLERWKGERRCQLKKMFKEMPPIAILPGHLIIFLLSLKMHLLSGMNNKPRTLFRKWGLLVWPALCVSGLWEDRKWRTELKRKVFLQQGRKLPLSGGGGGGDETLIQALKHLEAPICICCIIQWKQLYIYIYRPM